MRRFHRLILFVLLLLTAAPLAPGAAPPPDADPLARIAAHAKADPAANAAAATRGDRLPLGPSSGARPVNDDPLGTLNADERGRTRGLGGGYLLSTLGALGLVIGLMFFARWAYVKLGGRPVAASNPAVEVLSRTAVAPKNHVLLLRVGRRVLVVSDAGGGMRTLSDIEDPDEVADLLQSVTAAKAGSVSQSFGGLFERFNGKYDAAEQRRTEGDDGGERRSDATLNAISGLKGKIKTLGGSA